MTTKNRACPSCGGKDRFYLHYTAEHPHWRCRECGFTQEPTGEELEQGSAADRPKLTKEEQEQARSAYAAVATYCAPKLYTPEGKAALDYLHQRGFTDETLKAAGIGWHHDDRRNGVALDLWQNGEHDTYRAAQLAGLTGKQGVQNRVLQGTITIPYLYDHASKVATLRGRKLHRDSQDDPKYLSPAGQMYAGGRPVFYLHDVLDQADSVILTEGEFKALAAFQAWKAGALSMPAVATPSGAYLPSPLIKALKGKTVYLCYDNDTAGQRFTEQVLRKLEKACIDARVVRWPRSDSKLDIDGYILQHGAAAFQELIDQAEPESAILTALHKMGYTFRLNELSDTVEVNSTPITDITAAEIRTRMRRAGFVGIGAIEDEYTTEAALNKYHPIEEYLNGLTWDGIDYIGQLAAKMTSPDPAVQYTDGRTMPLHHVYMLRWLVGAVGKVFDKRQNGMLVLAGPQDIGKSALVAWLCSSLPDYFIEGPINPQDKDNDVRLMKHFIWEVSEIDATTRKSDVSALKAFITKHTVVVRKSYGRHDTIKPALCSFIGTLNDAGGFLNDETGNRRFYVTTINQIDWSYTSIPIDQLWAQAVALYRAGEAWRLLPEERTVQTHVNQFHDVETPIEGWVAQHCEFTGKDQDCLTLADLFECLGTDRVRDNQKSRNEIGSALCKFGATRARTGRARFFRGVKLRDPMARPSIYDSLVTVSDSILSPQNTAPENDENDIGDSGDSINSNLEATEQQRMHTADHTTVSDKLEKDCHHCHQDSEQGTTTPQNAGDSMTETVTEDRHQGETVTNTNVSDKASEDQPTDDPPAYEAIKATKSLWTVRNVTTGETSGRYPTEAAAQRAAEKMQQPK